MTSQQFWYDDIRLFDKYQKAHYRKMHDTAYLQGVYFNYALATQLSNFGKKKGERPAEYLREPLYPDFIKGESKPKAVEQSYRQTTAAWF